jgi:hypothetical protein
MLSLKDTVVTTHRHTHTLHGHFLRFIDTLKHQHTHSQTHTDTKYYINLTFGWLGWVFLRELHRYFEDTPLPVGVFLSGNPGLPKHNVRASIAFGFGTSIKPNRMISSPVFTLFHETSSRHPSSRHDVVVVDR